MSNIDPDVTAAAPVDSESESERIMLVRASKHTLVEDIFAITIGVALVSFGVVLFQAGNLVIGGVAGMALVTSYATGWDFGILFFAINLPFYLFGVGSLGWRFIIKTFCAVALMSVLVRFIPMAVSVEVLQPGAAALLGGPMIGLGLLALFRHGAGLGGINILVYWLQTNRGFRAGYVQLAVDACILVVSILVIGWQQAAWSVMGAVVFNLILGVNHRPGRYMGAS